MRTHGEVVRFRDGNGDERVGIYTRAFPEHNAIGVYVPGHREVVVYVTNVIT
jgi:hypothetical protein